MNGIWQLKKIMMYLRLNILLIVNEEIKGARSIR